MGERPTFSANVVRYGREEPLPERVPLRAGPLSAVLENGDLRYVRLDGELVVLRLYGAVRDRNWDTIEPRFIEYAVEQGDDRFAVRYTAECVGGDVDFVWRGQLTGTADGVITAVFDGEARSTFLRNRIGWCVLHPMSLAGLPVETETPDGPVSGSFPVAIAPWQPFFDMQAIAHPTAGGGRVTIRFEGDLFEMEDQRNWTDASYKTYSTPLRLPYPVEIAAGQRVGQTVTIEGTAGSRSTSPGPTRDAEPASVTLRVRDEVVGMMPAIGLGRASHGEPLNDREVELLQVFSPGHLRLPIDLTAEEWRDRLRSGTAEAMALGVPAELEVVAGDNGEGLDALFRAVQELALPLARVFVYLAGGYTTTGVVLDEAIARRDTAGIGAPVGGGSRAYFTELNRAVGSLPLGSMEIVGYAVNPQVHAFDNASLVETLRAQAETVRSGRAMAPDRTLAVGPITLKPRFNPNATGPDPALAPGTLPASVDARQPSLFAAAWTVGSLANLAPTGVDALTYYETTGWRGLIERSDHPLRVPGFHSWPGMVFPLFHVLADATLLTGGDVLPTETTDPLTAEALAVRFDGRLIVLVANLRDEVVAVSLELPVAGAASLRVLDETTFERAATEPDAHRDHAESVDIAGTAALTLLPYAVVTITIVQPDA